MPVLLLIQEGIIILETFTAPRALVTNPHFARQRQQSLQKLDYACIDPPIIDIVRGFAKLPHTFTLQCCYGHFVYPGNRDPNNFKPLPVDNTPKTVKYRIAYIALCIDDSAPGRELFNHLEEIHSIDPEYIQFGSADWFWERQINSYALQVEPTRYMTRDTCRIDYAEVLHVANIRDRFFERIRMLLREHLDN
jgi:hypothetical protein